MLARKKQAVKQEMKENPVKKILTNCPSCLQGLGRCNDPNLTAVHLARELAVIKGGENWQDRLKILLGQNEVVTF
jgi:Fe-S oxidoreductase